MSCPLETAPHDGRKRSVGVTCPTIASSKHKDEVGLQRGSALECCWRVMRCFAVQYIHGSIAGVVLDTVMVCKHVTKE
jgi:hypothetical protein